MIVLCPKAFSAQDEFSNERDFLKFYLSKTGKKATLANEVWETFRFKFLKAYPENAEEYIANFRGFVKPEYSKIDKDFQEEAPTKEYDSAELILKTKDFLRRNWAEVELFITTQKDLFSDITDIKIVTLEEFFIQCMSGDAERKILWEFWERIQDDKW